MTTVLYRVERAGSEELGKPVPLALALDQVKARAPKETEGALRIARVEYGLDPREIPTIHTQPMQRAWTATIEHFHQIGWLGTYVCKTSSQHRYGNATDWAAPKDMDTDADLIAYLWDVFKWIRAQGIAFEQGDGGLPYSEVIFRDKIATRAYDWRVRDYSGVLHASHVHASAYPLVPTSTPCGQV